MAIRQLWTINWTIDSNLRGKKVADILTHNFYNPIAADDHAEVLCSEDPINGHPITGQFSDCYSNGRLIL